jgi:hypothetical protein
MSNNMTVLKQQLQDYEEEKVRSTAAGDTMERVGGPINNFNYFVFKNSIENATIKNLSEAYKELMLTRADNVWGTELVFQMCTPHQKVGYAFAMLRWEGDSYSNFEKSKNLVNMFDILPDVDMTFLNSRPSNVIIPTNYLARSVPAYLCQSQEMRSLGVTQLAKIVDKLMSIVVETAASTVKTSFLSMYQRCIELLFRTINPGTNKKKAELMAMDLSPEEKIETCGNAIKVLIKRKGIQDLLTLLYYSGVSPKKKRYLSYENRVSLQKGVDVARGFWSHSLTSKYVLSSVGKTDEDGTISFEFRGATGLIVLNYPADLIDLMKVFKDNWAYLMRKIRITTDPGDEPHAPLVKLMESPGDKVVLFVNSKNIVDSIINETSGEEFKPKQGAPHSEGQGKGVEGDIASPKASTGNV